MIRALTNARADLGAAFVWVVTAVTALAIVALATLAMAHTPLPEREVTMRYACGQYAGVAHMRGTFGI